MKRLTKLAVALAIAGVALAAKADPAPDQNEDGLFQWRYPVVVVLKHDLQYEVFQRSARVDQRALAAPDAWQYLDRGVVGAIQSLEDSHQFQADHVYSHAIKGFAARLTAGQLKALENDPAVEVIEADRPMSINAQSIPWGIDKIDADLSSTRAGDGTGTVTGVNVYVLDTGVGAHADLNLVGHVNFAGGSNTDCHGHGTHVAGTIGAKDNTSDVVGVAPGVRVYGVKVLDCNGSGSYSGVIKGIDWVTANAVKPAVANMSLGGGASTAVDDAVRRSAAAGVVYAIAAGNSGADACRYSPARAGAGTNNGIITTAATDSSDREASFSNYGRCVDTWSPGVGVVSTKLGGGTTSMSGTSMASPHTAGAAALYLSRVPTATPTAVESAIKSTATAPGTRSKDGRAITRINVRTF